MAQMTHEELHRRAIDIGLDVVLAIENMSLNPEEQTYALSIVTRRIQESLHGALQGNLATAYHREGRWTDGGPSPFEQSAPIDASTTR